MSLAVRALQSIHDISACDWDACANPGLEQTPFDPFISHAFLAALESSGCVSEATGWKPFHLILENEDAEIRALAPAYLKSHSRGEYIFDAGWADALYRAGGHYYPKLLIAVPFSPVTGRRLLVHPNADPTRAQSQLMQGCAAICEQNQISSTHINFMPKAEWQTAAEVGYLQRTDQQYHWINKNYKHFDDFLAELSAKKRKNLKRERREAVKDDIQIKQITGGDIKEHHWDAFYQFYLDTGARKWGTPYLNRTFFSLIGEAMPERLLITLCERAGQPIAGALHVIGGDALFGRYWGCTEQHRFLHFEACYYQAIDFAIQHKLRRVEAGAQGAHKAIRGYLPCPTFSAHWILHPGLREAVAHFLNDETSRVRADIAYMEDHTPYKKTLDLKAFDDLGRVTLDD